MLSFLFDASMATAPVTGYVMQYRLIVLNKSVGAFSTDICLALLFANIMRLNFYLFRQYELALLFQSLFMITAQVLLLRICTQYQGPPPKQSSDDELTSQPGTRQVEEEFWRWSNFDTYVKYIVVFGLGTLAVSLIMKLLQVSAYGDLVGLIALLSESLLILPQIIQIQKQGRVVGISRTLLLLNLAGDIIKMYYFVVKDQPFQFKMCGTIQIILDSFVLLQVWYYNRREQLIEVEEEKNGGTNRQDNKDLEGSLTHTVVLEENLQLPDPAESDSTRGPNP